MWQSFPFHELEILPDTIPLGRSFWERHDNVKGAFSQVNSRDNWGSSAQEHLDPRGKRDPRKPVVVQGQFTTASGTVHLEKQEARQNWTNQEILANLKQPKKFAKGGSRDRYPRKDVETLPEHAKMWLGKSKPTWNGIWRGMSKHLDELPQVHKQKKEDWGNLSPMFNWEEAPVGQDTQKKCWVPSSL